MAENGNFLQVGNLRIANKDQVPYLKINGDPKAISGDIINWLRMGVPCVQVETNNGCLTGGTYNLKPILEQATMPREKFVIFGTKVQITPGMTHFFVRREMVAT
jgi:hypothetical protein